MKRLFTCPVCKETVNTAIDEYHVVGRPHRNRYYHARCWRRRQAEAEWVERLLDSLRDAAGC